MLLNVPDRLVLLTILPVQGDILTLRVLNDLKSRLSFTEEEIANLQFSSTEKGTFWKRGADVDVEIEIGQKANQMICDAFRSLEKRKELKLEFLPVYDKFITEE